MLGSSKEILFSMHIIEDLRRVMKKNWAITLPRAMGGNSATYLEGCGSNGHNRKVAENEGTHLGAEDTVTRGPAPSEATGKDPRFLDLRVKDVQMDDSVSQRSPPYHRWVEGWKRRGTLARIFE